MIRKTKRIFALLLAAILVCNTFIQSSTFVIAEEDSETSKGNVVEQTDTEAETDDSAAVTVDNSGDAAESAELAENTIEPVMEREAVEDDEDGSLKVTLSGADLKPSGTLGLEETGVNVSSGFRSTFTLHIETVFPAGSDKILEITLPYGMGFDSFGFVGTVNNTTSWYINEVEKVTAPHQQVGSKKADVIELDHSSAGSGTLTYKFKDTTESVSFDIPVMTMYAATDKFPNLHNIKDAVKVSQSFTAVDGTSVNRVRKIDNLEIKYNNGSEAATISMNNYKPFTNENGNLPISFEGDTSNTVAYSVTDQRVGWTHRKLLEDYYISFLVPEGTGYKGLYKYEANWIGADFDKPQIKMAGEKYMTSKGEEKTVPDGKTLYTFQTKGATTTASAISDSRASFVPIWNFEDGEKFPEGTLAVVQMVDVGLKYSSQGGEVQNYLPFNEKKLTSVTYEIVGKKENTFVETVYQKDNKGNFIRAGYVSDITLDIGAPGQEFIQEYWAGYFIIGNRGTADSQSKRVTLEYDVNQTALIGITGQIIPKNKAVAGIPDTKITNFKYKLWNAKTGNETDWISWDAGKEIPDELTVTDVSQDADDYLKAIQYDIDTIPLQTYLGDSGNSKAKSFNFYGKVLTSKVSPVQPDPVPQGNADQYLSTVTLENIDGSDKLLGRTFTGTSGKVVMSRVHKSWGAEGDTAIYAGETANIVFSALGAGSNETAGVVNKIWVISPNGSKIDNWKIQKAFYNDAFRSDLYTDNSGRWTYDDISKLVSYKEVPATPELKAKYPDAKLYEFDFTKIAENDTENYSRARIIGPQMRTKKRADGTRPASFDSYWFVNGEIVISGDYHSEISEKPLRREGALTWIEMKSDTNVQNEDGTPTDVQYPNTYEDDRFHLSGSGSKLISNNYLTVHTPNKLFIEAAIKEASEPDSAYRTYNIKDDSTAIGLHSDKANQELNYKLNLINNTGNPIKSAEVYFPIPKKGDNWGKNVNPKGAFNFDISLTGGLQDRIPEGYKVSYVKKVKPVANTLLWKNFQWVDDKDTADWTSDDWKDVNFVRIERTEPLGNGNDNEFVFNLSTDGGEVQKIDAWAPAFRYEIEGSTGWGYGKPAAVILLDGRIVGTVWHDLNHDGMLDVNEKRIAGANIKLFSQDANGARWNLLAETQSGSDGKYMFDPIWVGKTYEVEVEIPDDYKDFTITGDDLDNSFEKNSDESDRLGIVDVEFEKGSKLVEVNAGVIYDLYKVSYRFTGEIPDNIEAPESVEAEETQTIKVETEPFVEGYTFEGWKPESPANLDVQDGEFIMPSENVVFIGNWLRNQYKVAYVVKGDEKYGIPDGGAAPINNGIYYFGDSFKPTGKPETAWNTSDGTSDGLQGRWKFIGWTTDANDISEANVDPDKEYIITADITFYGKWEFIRERDIQVTKIWDDENNKDAVRPDSIRVKLVVNGKESSTEITLSADNGWKGVFKELLVFSGEKEIEYSIIEENVPQGYKESYAGSMEAGFTITNEKIKAPTPKTSDETKLSLYAVMMIMSTSIALLFGVIRRRHISFM